MSEPAFSARVLFSTGNGTLPTEGGAPPGVRVVKGEGRVPDADVARAVGNSWYWPEAADAFAKHTAHVEVSLAAEIGSPVARALALTKALAALAARPGCVGVLWDPTMLPHDPAQWIAQAEDATEDDLPLFLWIAFEGTEREDGTRSLWTRGAELFGAREVEVAGSKRDGEEVLETVCDVALYVMTSPVPLEDGDQVEVTRGKVRVRIEPSLRNDGSRAYRLRLP